jgi:hypothetical protein
MKNLRWWADLLDARFRIPGTQIRFGIDPILSLVPGFGELATPIFTMVLFAHAITLSVPKIILVRMALNALIDAAIGALPIVGNIGDIFWRANAANLVLLERYARPGVRPRPADYAFVWAVTAIFGMILIIPVILGVTIAIVLWHWIAS